MSTVPGYLPFYPVNYRPNPIYIQNRRPVPKKYGFRFPGKESEKVIEVEVEDMEEADLKETSYKPTQSHVPANNPAHKKYGFKLLREQIEKEDSEFPLDIDEGLLDSKSESREGKAKDLDIETLKENAINEEKIENMEILKTPTISNDNIMSQFNANPIETSTINPTEDVTTVVDTVMNVFKDMLGTVTDDKETDENVTLTPEEIENLMELKEMLEEEPKKEVKLEKKESLVYLF